MEHMVWMDLSTMIDRHEVSTMCFFSDVVFRVRYMACVRVIRSSCSLLHFIVKIVTFHSGSNFFLLLATNEPVSLSYFFGIVCNKTGSGKSLHG